MMDLVSVIKDENGENNKREYVMSKISKRLFYHSLLLISEFKVYGSFRIINVILFLHSLLILKIFDRVIDIFVIFAIF